MPRGKASRDPAVPHRTGRHCVGAWIAGGLAPILTSAAAAAQYLRGDAEPAATEPSLIQQILFRIAQMQARLNAELTETIRSAQSGDSLAPAMAIIGAAFLYGVLHAAGPGHGKAVVATYFLTHPARWLRGVGTGFAVAMIQAVTAILLVSILAVALGVALTQVLDRAVTIELLSYGLIVGLGLAMLYRVATGQAACGHDHGDHDHPHGPDSGGTGLRGWIGRVLPADLAPLAVAVGLRPCSGAIIILLFTLANGIFLIGALATFSMAFGTALVVSLAGVLAIAARRSVTGTDRGHAFVARIQTGVTVAGALVIIALGGLMFAGALHRGGLLGM